MSRKHAILGASSSKRWMSCPGSVRMTSSLPPSPSSKYAELGTAAHTLGEWCIEQDRDPREFKGETITTDEGNSFIVDNDMIDAVRVYYDFVKETAHSIGLKIGEVEIEKQFDLSWLHPDMFGTNDASFGAHFGDFHIVDYKHGAGIAVDAIDNTQMLYYAIGAAYNAKEGHWEDYEKIHMTIVQPRAFHSDGQVRTWTITMEELIEWSKKLKQAAIATEAKDAPLVPGEEACRWCGAASFCVALKSKAQDVAKQEFGVIPSEDPALIVDKMSIEDCVKIINHKKMLDGLVKACETRVSDIMLKSRKKVEGMKYVKGKGSRDWVDPTEAQRALSQSYPLDKIMTMKLKTPAQMEKELGKAIVKDFIVKKEGAITVAPMHDRRKEVELDAASDFK